MPTEMMSPECLALGGAISVVVSALKKIPLVKRFPKVVSMVLATLTSVLMPLVTQDPMIWKTIVMCVLQQFAAAVATHEAVVQPVNKHFGTGPTRRS